MQTAGLINVQKRNSALQTPSPIRFTDSHRIQIPSEFSGYGLPYEHHFECKWGRYQATVRVEDSLLICERTGRSSGGYRVSR